MGQNSRNVFFETYCLRRGGRCPSTPREGAPLDWRYAMSVVGFGVVSGVVEVESSIFRETSRKP